MVVGLNSFHIIDDNIVSIINDVDTFLLTMAMTALGIGTILSKFKNLGLIPIYVSTIMFLWLVIGGFVVVKMIV
jgi:uncharacterized membrane protein YadS